MIPAPPSADAGARPWPVLAVALFASVAAAMAQFTVPPLMPLLAAEFGVDPAAAGGLMSVFSLTGLALALPAGLIVRRSGPLAVGLVALGSVVVGSALGALAHDFGVLLLSRAVQGVGVGLIAVVAPALIAAVFPPDARGIPMGIWATWAPLAGVLMFNFAGPIAGTYGWRGAWWFVAGAAAVAAVVFLLVVRGLPRTEAGRSADAPPPSSAALRPGPLWTLAATFAIWCLGFAALNTFLPTYLVEVHGYDLGAAASVTSLVLVAFIVGSPLAGVLSDRIGSRRLVFTAAILLLAVAWPVVFAVDPAALPAVLIAIGLVVGAVPPTVFAAAPELVGDPRLAPMAMAVVMVGQNGGQVVGPPLFGATLSATGWGTAALVLAGVTALGAATGWLTRAR